MLATTAAGSAAAADADADAITTGPKHQQHSTQAKKQAENVVESRNRLESSRGSMSSRRRHNVGCIGNCDCSTICRTIRSKGSPTRAGAAVTATAALKSTGQEAGQEAKQRGRVLGIHRGENRCGDRLAAVTHTMIVAATVAETAFPGAASAAGTCLAVSAAVVATADIDPTPAAVAAAAAAALQSRKRGAR